MLSAAAATVGQAPTLAIALPSSTYTISRHCSAARALFCRWRSPARLAFFVADKVEGSPPSRRIDGTEDICRLIVGCSERVQDEDAAALNCKDQGHSIIETFGRRYGRVRGERGLDVSGQDDGAASQGRGHSVHHGGQLAGRGDPAGRAPIQALAYGRELLLRGQGVRRRGDPRHRIRAHDARRAGGADEPVPVGGPLGQVPVERVHRHDGRPAHSGRGFRRYRIYREETRHAPPPSPRRPGLVRHGPDHQRGDRGRRRGRRWGGRNGQGRRSERRGARRQTGPRELQQRVGGSHAHRGHEGARGVAQPQPRRREARRRRRRTGPFPPRRPPARRQRRQPVGGLAAPCRHIAGARVRNRRPFGDNWNFVGRVGESLYHQASHGGARLPPVFRRFCLRWLHFSGRF